MGLRSWMCAVVVSLALVAVACTSPGTPYAYRDLKVSLGPSSSPAQPATTQTSTISFTLRNTWNQPVTGVKWILRDTTDPMSPVDIDQDDTVAIDAFGRIVIEVALGVQSAGTRTYAVEVDPDDTHPEEDEDNNTSDTLTVVTANQDIAFGTPAAAITPTEPTSAQQLTLTFTLNHILNAALTPPGSAVSVPYSITVKNTPDDTPVAVVPDAANPASPANVDPAGTIPLPVSVTLPPTGSAGRFIYTITLSPADGDDGNPNNNTVTVTVDVPANS